MRLLDHEARDATSTQREPVPERDRGYDRSVPGRAVLLRDLAFEERRHVAFLAERGRQRALFEVELGCGPLHLEDRRPGHRAEAERAPGREDVPALGRER